MANYINSLSSLDPWSRYVAGRKVADAREQSHVYEINWERRLRVSPAFSPLAYSIIVSRLLLSDNHTIYPTNIYALLFIHAMLFGAWQLA